MKIKKWKEVKPKEKGIILFTILSILLIVGVFFYQSFAIFKANTNQDMIEGNVENIGDLEFAFYIDGELSPTVPKKNSEYSFDSSSSYCKDMKTGAQVSNIVWNDTRWSAEIKDITNTKTKCFLNFKQIYKETELNGAIPDLMNGRLVPVKIDETKPNDMNDATGGKVTKADITDDKNPWYSYENKQWANAVILKDKSITYQDNEEIPESEIESYFVWIPRYRYKLQDGISNFNSYSSVENKGQQQDVNAFYDSINGNKATNHPFEIHFENKDDEETLTGDYLTHPAFIAFDTNGLWVGKFETGYNQNEDNKDVTPKDTWQTESAQVNDIQPTKVIIKPNVYSWRNINVSNAFYTSYEYKRELESHMMKNTEWGAVAYLTNSIYGRCTSNNCDEVSMNNESSYITGWSTTKSPTCGYTVTTDESCNYSGGPANLNTLSENELYSYYKIESQSGSTTGNYSGIYDLSGGAWEYVMGVMQASDGDINAPASGRDTTKNSGFTGSYSNGEGENATGLPWPSSKYYDLYDYNILNQQYQRGILGDATKEVGPFYSVSYQKSDTTYGPGRYVSSYNADLSDFLYYELPWFVRGGVRYGGTDSGIFAFGNGYGSEDVFRSFRIVLAL